ncbi:MAG: hypothetical protein WC248_05060 [Candidatus Methanomethylophilaceae archaeon]|jgi:hypothetical protein
MIGYGSVYKLPGNRRKPYIACKTIGYDDDGKHQIKAIGYYTKKEQALSALAEYNNAPYKLNTADVTFAVIFEQWKSRKYQSISESNKHGYNMAFKHTAPLHDLRFTDIKSDKTPENTWITNILLTHC